MRKHIFSRRLKPYAITLSALLAVGAICHLVSRWREDVAEWPAYPAFRCRGCEGAAHVDPGDSRWWGCPQCDVMTRELTDHFYQATPADFYGPSVLWKAYVQAGIVCSPDDPERRYGGSPTEAWNRDCRR